MLDGEIVIAGPTGLDFDALSQRIHPAEKRINLLAERRPRRSSPSTCWPRTTARSWRRRTRSAAGAREALKKATPPVHLTPVTRSRRGSRLVLPLRRRRARWRRGQGRRAHLPADKRVMLKVKHQRTADCVVAGFRTHKDGAGVGSLLLGLFDDAGTLHHVGVASGFSVARRRELVDELEPYRKDARRTTPGRAGPRRRRPAARRAGRPLERRQGHDLGAGAARVRLRGLLRPPTGRPLPPCDVLRALAARPRPRVVHLRAARLPGADGAERGLRDGEPLIQCSLVRPTGAGTILRRAPSRHLAHLHRCFVAGAQRAGQDVERSEIMGLAAESARTMASSVGLIVLLSGELDRREGWRDEGATSLESLTAGAPLENSVPTARAFAHVGGRLYDLPQLADALWAGELSFDKVRAVVDAATPELTPSSGGSGQRALGARTGPVGSVPKRDLSRVGPSGLRRTVPAFQRVLQDGDRPAAGGDVRRGPGNARGSGPRSPFRRRDTVGPATLRRVRRNRPFLAVARPRDPAIHRRGPRAIGHRY